MKLSVWKSFIRSTTASMMLAFALMAPVMVGAVGMALDYSQAYLVQQRLGQALDAAALAGAASSSDPDEIEQKIREFFEANYPENRLGVTFDPEVEIIGNQVHVTGHARYATFFINILGIEDVNITAETTVQRLVQGVEGVLVLDNTGSMADHNNISTLKTATRNFINILFDNTDNPEGVKIGLVPYSNTVNVGRYGLGKNPDGTTYADGDVFVTLPSGMSYTTDHSSANWYGCVVEHKQAGYNSTATHVANSKGQLWTKSSAWNSHGWDPAKTTNDPYNYDVDDNYTGPWDIYSYGRVIGKDAKCSDISSSYTNSRCSNCTGSSSRCNSTYCYCWMADSNEGTNQGCPFAAVQPLTSDRDLLLSQVEADSSAEPDDMEPHGNTLGNIGMSWGYRLISPEAPFEEAHDWDDIHWQKYVIMMTDGDNTENAEYSSFWFTSKNAMTVTKFNQRFEETCTLMKQKGITVYTITFTSGINSTTKGYYRRCASDDSKYYDAPTQQDLLDVFERISREISNLHISQ